MPVVAPLPVWIVATYDEYDTPNAMNVAWAGQCSYHHVAWNLSLNHKTTENLKRRKAFTLSIATVDTLILSDYFGRVSGHKENKIEKAGVHVTHSEFVDAPVIEEYPLTLECKVIEMRDALGEMHVVGEVTNVQAAESVLDVQGKVVIVKTCSDSRFTIVQKNSQLFVAKLHNFLSPDNRMSFYRSHSVLLFPALGGDTFLPAQSPG